MGERIELEIDGQKLLQEIYKTEQEAQRVSAEAHTILNEVDERTRISFNNVLNAARGAYLVGIGLTKAGGESISYFFRAMISAAFSTAAILGPQLQAALAKGEATYDPWAIAQAVFGMISLGTSIGAAVAAQQQQMDIARSLRGADMALLGIQQLIGTFSNF